MNVLFLLMRQWWRTMKCIGLVISFSLLFTSPLNAQQITWDAPVHLTREDSVVQFSAIAADSYGGVHIFWAYRPDTGEPTDLIFYRNRYAAGWREATDLFVGQERELFERPTAICDENNRLHLLWNGINGLYYSTAPATEAYNPRQWQAPSLVAQAGALRQTSIGVTSDSVLHVVYTHSYPDTNVMYVRSEDMGLFWSAPVPISNILPGDGVAPDTATMIRDSQDTLHVVWVENYPPEYLGRHVRYAQSQNSGLTWTQPQTLSDLPRGTGWNWQPNIVEDAGGTLHLMWAGCKSEGVSRCYRSSEDAGVTWGPIEMPFQQLIGSSGRDVLVADPYGGVYWAGSLRYPQAFYFSARLDKAWRDPPQALFEETQTGRLGSAHFPQMVIGEGNQLHLLLVEGDGGRLVYVHGQTAHPTVRQPVPTISLTSTLAVLVSTTSAIESESKASASISETVLDTPAETRTVFQPIALAALAVLVLLAVVLVAFRRQGRC